MNSRLSIFPLILAVVSPHVEAQQIGPVIDAINQVNLDSLTTFVRELSGETSTMVDGKQVTLFSRAARTTDNETAARYLMQKLSSFGLSPILQSYSLTGSNVYAIQSGVEYPEISYMVCAHYDDRPGTGAAPGADDNASGTAAVLETARILSSYKTVYSVIYALWDEEETGLFGSRYFAQLAAGKRDSILGVLNLEMFGWDNNIDGGFEVHAKNIARSVELADTVMLVNQLYGIGLKPKIYNPGTTASDHASFWQNGYGAVVMSEEYWGGDFNSHYHSSTDRLQFFNKPYFHRASRLAVGTLAFVAGIQGSPPPPIRPWTFTLRQNYPNPFNSTTTVEFFLPYPAMATLEVFDILGRRVTTLAAKDFTAGEHQATWEAKGAASGVYFYRLRAEYFTETRKMILAR